MGALAQDQPAIRVRPGLQKDHRRHRRTILQLHGRFLNAANEEHSFVTTDISCGGVRLQSQFIPEIGSQIVCYVDELGRIVGHVNRHSEGGFAAAFHVSQIKRDRLADKLTWLVNKDKLGLSEERGAQRFNAEGPAIVIRQDGRRLQCRVVDISLTGAGFECEGPAPLLGEVITVGNISAEVVRSTRKGFGARFVRPPVDGKLPKL